MRQERSWRRRAAPPSGPPGRARSVPIAAVARLPGIGRSERVAVLRRILVLVVHLVFLLGARLAAFATACCELANAAVAGIVATGHAAPVGAAATVAIGTAAAVELRTAAARRRLRVVAVAVFLSGQLELRLGRLGRGTIDDVR